MEASDSPKSIAKEARNKILALPYMAKLLNGKTFAFGMQFMEKLLQLPNAKSFTLRKTYRITYSTKIHGKIFGIECKIVKSTKVFPLESFAVCGSTLKDSGKR